MIKTAVVFLFLSSLSIYTIAQKSLLGFTIHGGGSNSWGALYSTDSSGNNLSVLKSFEVDKPGISPNSPMLKASNGKLYGMVYQGGDLSNGMNFEDSKGGLFEYDPAV